MWNWFEIAVRSIRLSDEDQARAVLNKKHPRYSLELKDAHVTGSVDFHPIGKDESGKTVFLYRAPFTYKGDVLVKFSRINQS